MTRKLSSIEIDPAVFDPKIAPKETVQFNAKLIEELSALPDYWTWLPKDVRKARAEGRGAFPVDPDDPHAKTISIEGPGGAIDMRCVCPRTKPAVGSYLHIHGGGWMYGSSLGQDGHLREFAEACGLNVLSIEYRLAPEHPWPQGPEDCERAALWLVKEQQEFETDFLLIGGESAGAHLSALTLLRLRDKHGLTPFHAANLVAGCFDLGLTPSARNFGNEKLILTTRDITLFTENLLQNGEDRRSAEVSPLYAELDDMPPAIFSVGTRDALVDDSIFMATRWAACGVETQLRLFPGCPHVFQSFDLEQARESKKLVFDFVNAQIQDQVG